MDNAGNIGALSSEKSGTTGDAPGLNMKSRSETALTFTDNIKENPNSVTPTPDDSQGSTELDKATDNGAVEQNASGEVSFNRQA